MNFEYIFLKLSYQEMQSTIIRKKLRKDKKREKKLRLEDLENVRV